MFSSVMYMLHNVFLKHSPKFFYPHSYKNMFLICSITKFGVTICAYNDNSIFEALACSKGLWILPSWGGVSTAPPIFEAKYIGSVKYCIFHGDWRFHLFKKIIFPKFRLHLDLHIYHWDFWFITY
jgi:hypothetical protein